VLFRSPEIDNFSDKRFIGTHINEAIALYHIGEKLKESDPIAALSAWQEAKDRFDRCEDQLRFIPEEQFNQAVHSLAYYRALSLHKKWGISQKQEDLRVAQNAWKKYIESTAKLMPSDPQYAMTKRAEVFYRQIQGLIEETDQAKVDRVGTVSKAF
jgi:serine phosphatase RsbU (regulator of sigma subunit)